MPLVIIQLSEYPSDYPTYLGQFRNCRVTCCIRNQAGSYPKGNETIATKYPYQKRKDIAPYVVSGTFGTISCNILEEEICEILFPPQVLS